jgi:hypothetical protein
MPQQQCLRALASPVHQMWPLVAASPQLQCRSHFLQHQRGSTGQVDQGFSDMMPQMILSRTEPPDWLVPFSAN